MAAAGPFGELYAVLDAAIRAVAAHWHLRGAEAEDFAQDVYLAILRDDQAALHRFRGDDAFAYFYQIASRVRIDRHRAQFGRHKKSSRRDGDETFDGPANDARQDAIPSIEPEWEATELRAHIVRGLTRVLAVLDPDERAVLARRFGRGESMAAITREAGGSRRSAARHLSALLDEMRDLLLQVQVSEADVRYALARGRIDAGLLDELNPTRPDPTRPLRSFWAVFVHDGGFRSRYRFT